jgi:hypothetical protein
MKYTYTVYREDGIATEVVESEKQLSFKATANKPGLYDMLDCRTIEIIPRDYYPGADEANENVTYYGDEEARFVEDYKRNLHMKTLVDSRGGIWDVVGTLVREEKISE